LKLNFTDAKQSLYNSGIVDFRHHINGFIAGEKYVFRIKYGKDSGAYPDGKRLEEMHGAYSLVNSDTPLTLKVSQFDLVDGEYTFSKDNPPLFTWKTTQGRRDEYGYLVSNGIEC
jgi:hypothetical protein